MMLEKIQNYYEKSTVGKIVVLGTIIIPFAVFAFIIISKKREKDTPKSKIDNSQLVIYEQDTTFSNKKSGYYQGHKEPTKIERSDDFFDYSDDVKKIKEDIENGTGTDSVYNEETDPRFALMEQQIKQMSANAQNNVKVTPSTNKQTQRTQRTPKPSVKAVEVKKELTYEEKLELSKKKRLESVSSYGYNDTSHKDSFEVLVFETQRKLPGQRLVTILPKDTQIQGRNFKKGTRVYCFININESRIFLNVSNINKVPMKLGAYDPEDDDLGLYSERAAILWEQFKNDTKDNTEGAVSDEISEGLNVPVIGSIMSDVKNYFKTKRIKEKEKLLFVNNHTITIKTIEE